MAFGLVAVAYILALIFTIALIFLTIFHPSAVTQLVLPEYLLHGAYTVLFIITFQLGTAIFNIPLMAYHVYRMSLICSLSNEVPEHPVISPKSGHVFERRVIEKYLQENGTDPIDQQPLTVEELIEIKTSPFVRPKPPSATSIPAILKTLQDEWDAVMLQSFTLRQQLQTARQELSHALYQHDAACRVIARLTKEVTAAREALATLKPQAGIMAPGAAAAPASTPAVPGGQQVTDTSGDAVMIDANQLQEEIGVSDDVIQTLQERASQLTAERKRRGKTVPEGLAKSRNISEYQQLSSLVGLHSASMPGILSVDISKASPDRIVTGGNDKNAVVFNLASSQVISILRGHTKKVTNVVYHPAEELVFTGSPDTTVRVWGVEQGQCASVIRAHKGAVTGLSIHATGDYLLSSSADGQWAFSDLRHGRVLVRVSAVDKSGALQSLTCAQFHPDGLILGTGTGDGEVKIWDVKERRNVANFGHGTTGANQTVTALAFSENGYYLATGGADGQVKLWDLRKLKNFKTLVPGEEQPAAYEIHDIEFDQSGSYLGIAGTDCRIYLCKQWDQLALFNDHTAPATGCRFGENANRFITVSLDRSVKVFGL
ncbi:pre-mRNA-processing factor 19 [Clonorchis sinensis]|uniref:Pre-mRNA-processing factor 19 n=1 Tax=Clonorchis sinensis TaxID=79923 RepID=H2KQE3_CLOSI|nr:pre-mRNA-processing factor 19 [Clonorchis sinensis]